MKMNKLMLSIAYTAIVFGIVFILQYAQLPSPFDWLLILLASIAVMHFFPSLSAVHSPIKDILNDIGTFDDQLIYLGQLFLVPVLAYVAVLSGGSRWGVPIGAAALAFIAMAGLSVMKREAHTHVVYTGIGPTNLPVVYVYYSRRKALFPLMMTCIFGSILAGMTLFLYCLKGEIPAYLHAQIKVLGGLILVVSVLSAWELRRLKHKDPILTLHPNYLQYHPFGRPAEMKSWEEIVQTGFVYDGAKRLLLLQLQDATTLNWNIKGLGITLRSTHLLIKRYAEDYAPQARHHRAQLIDNHFKN